MHLFINSGLVTASAGVGAEALFHRTNGYKSVVSQSDVVCFPSVNRLADQ